MVAKMAARKRRENTLASLAPLLLRLENFRVRTMFRVSSKESDDVKLFQIGSKLWPRWRLEKRRENTLASLAPSLFQLDNFRVGTMFRGSSKESDGVKLFQIG